MKFENKTIIIAETNFLQETLYNVYIGKREFSQVVWREINERLQTVRDIARKEDEQQ